MTYKKTWFSYVLWAVFTCITGVMLANYTILFWTKYIDSTVGYGTVALISAVFAAVIGIYFLIRKGILPVAKKVLTNEHIAVWCEIFAAGCIFAGGLGYRLYLYAQTGTEMITETAFYHQAMVTSSDMVSLLTHGASWFYTLFLSFILSFLGNKVEAGVWMQIVLQMLSLLLGFLTVRRSAGRVPACVSMLMMAFSSVYAHQIFSLTPETFFFVIYLLGMFLIVCYVCDYTNNQFRNVSAVAGAVLSGIVLGILIYLDAIAVSLVIFLVGILSGTRRLKEGEHFPATWFSILLLVLSVVTGALTLWGMFALDASFSNAGTVAVSRAWFTLYYSHLTMGYILYQTELSIIECLIQVMVTAFLIMSFWNRKKEQNCTPWIFLMLLLAPTPLTVLGVLPYQVFSIFTWSVLAGIGFGQSFAVDAVKRKDEQKDIEPNDMEHKGMEPKNEEPEKAGIEAKQTEPPKPRFIENPLPLPKKHEKKEMDYQYEVAEDKMKFDVTIKENDDFDI